MNTTVFYTTLFSTILNFSVLQAADVDFSKPAGLAETGEKQSSSKVGSPIKALLTATDKILNILN